jgi:hypothetical protein
MREISKLEANKDNSNGKPFKKRKRPIEREITAHSIAPPTETARIQTFLSTLETKRGTIFSHGSDNFGEGSAQNGEGPSRPFEHTCENELLEEESKDLDTINRLNLLLLRYHASRNEDLIPVLKYREQKQPNQQTIQEALKNWKALSDLSNGKIQWDQIKEKDIWNKIKGYKQLTGKFINIDYLDQNKQKTLDEVLKKVNREAIQQFIAQDLHKYLADEKILQDKSLQNNLIQAVYHIQNIKFFYSWGYPEAMKKEIIDFIHETYKKDVPCDISHSFLSKILDQASQKRVLTLLQPDDTLAEHSQARGAELQESVASTSTPEQGERHSSSKQVENLTDPQEPKAKKRRSFTQTKREHYDPGWDDASRKFDSMNQGTASSHQTMKETRQQESDEKLTLDEIDELINVVYSIQDFNARKFKPTDEKIQSLVEKLDKTGLDEEQWGHAYSILNDKGFKSKDKPYRYFDTRRTSVRISQARNNARSVKKINSTYGGLGRYKNVRAQQAGFDNDHDWKNARARLAGFDNETDRENARARRRGYSNEYDLKNALAQKKGYRDVHNLLNAQSKKKGFTNRYQHYKK